MDQNQPSLADDDALVADVNSAAGTGLRRVGRAADGTLGGAIYVEWPDGRGGVLTRFLGTPAEARRTAAVLEQVHRLGLPVPRHELITAVGDAVFVVQQRLPGSPPTEVTATVIDAIAELNERFAGVLEDRSDVPVVPLCLDRSGDPYPKHEVLAAHSDRSRRVLAAVRQIGSDDPRPVTGSDLVHIDLTPPNVLFGDAGLITGIVDWNLGAYRGDRHLALIKTRFELEWAIHSPNPNPAELAAATRLDMILSERVALADARRYWAHRLLYQLHFALQCAPAAVIDWHLDVAENRLLGG